MKSSKLSKIKRHRILQCFCDELTAVQTSKICKVNRNTVDAHFTLYRETIASYQEEQKTILRGNIEIDESYFGSRHKGDKRGRSTERKIPVIGILKRNGQVYTQIIPDASRKSLLPIIQGLIDKSRSNIYTDQWRSYDGLILQGYKHTRINHSQEFAASHNHINGIESFWSYVKRKMRKHNGIPRNKFYLYLKESEFRFNNRNKNIYKIIHNLLGDYWGLLGKTLI